MDVALLPERTKWHLTWRVRLTPRERRRLRHRPDLLAEQRAWVAGAPRRINEAFKRAFTRDIVSILRDNHPLFGSII